MAEPGNHQLAIPSSQAIQAHQEEERKLLETNHLDVIHQIRIWNEYLLSASCFAFLLLLSYNHLIPQAIPFLMMIIYEFIWIACLIYSYHSATPKKLILFELAFSVSSCLFYMFLILCITTLKLFLVLSCTPLFTTNLVSLLQKPQYSSNCKQFNYKLETIYRWVLAVTILFSGLNSLDVIKWRKIAVFWPLWIAVGALFIVGSGHLWMSIKIINKFFKGEYLLNETICPLWMTLFSYGTGGCIASLIISLSFPESKLITIDTVLLIIAIFYFSLWILTFVVRTHLISWFELYFYSGNVIYYGNRFIIPPILQENPNLRVYSVKDFPKVMFRVSSTFYVKSEEEKPVEAEEDQIIVEVSVEGSNTCSICFSGDSNSILMDCGHSGICFECACEMMKKLRKCHVCRAYIDKVLEFKKNDESYVDIIRAFKY